MLGEVGLGSGRIINFHDIPVIIGVRIVAEIILQLFLVGVVIVILVIPIPSIGEVEFFGHKRRPPGAHAAEAENPGTVDAAEI